MSSQHSSHRTGSKNHYARLGLMALLSFLAMYILMYAMVASAGEVYNNFNQVYMAGLMTAPMVVIELALMASMYRNRKLNAVLIGISILGGIVCFTFIRQQTVISDRQFLRSMIPHHSGAILMCEEASIQNPTLQELCRAIIASQRTEIEQMKALLHAGSER